MMKIIQDSAALFFITAVVVLSTVSVLGVWDFFAQDVISKSFQTLGLLAIVSVVVIVAGRYIDARNSAQGAVVYTPLPAFSMLRKLILALLIIMAVVLALLGVMAIWDVIADKTVLWKSIGSLAILAFGAFIIVLTCTEREKIPTVNPDGTVSSANSVALIGVITALLIAGWFVMTALNNVFNW